MKRMSTTTKLSDLFGSMVFNEDTMKERLSSASYEAWKKCVTDGTSLDISTANEIAQAMKQWAVEKGATHYTHWFQPMTGVTAEKHDSFIAPAGGGKILMEFSGKELIKGEQLGAYCKMFNEVTLKPGCEIGYHEHHGETETYYLTKGEGIYNDNGKEYPVEVGDVTFCADGNGHGIKNAGKEDLVFVALILKE